MIDPLPTWVSTLAALPKVADDSWASGFASWYAARILNKITTFVGPTPLPALVFASPLLFTFPTATFADALRDLTPTGNALSGITGFADAWKKAIDKVVFPTKLAVASGAFIPPTGPTTLFSVVTAVSLVPASVTAARAKIIELATAPAVTDPTLSQFPVKFRAATLLLKIKVTGKDSTPPSSGGPLDLEIDNVPLV